MPTRRPDRPVRTAKSAKSDGQIFWLSDRALHIDLTGGGWSASLIIVVQDALNTATHEAQWPAHEWMLADCSLTCVFNEGIKSHSDFQQYAALLRSVLDHSLAQPLAPGVSQAAPREHVIAVRYGPEFGADFSAVCKHLNCSPEHLVSLHTSAMYTVEFLGFLPGFAYLSGTASALHLPRMSTPRSRVPAGSVAVAAGYCAVYPQACPGGWHLLGVTNHTLFDPNHNPPAQLQPGDVVRFVEASHA
ncbi:MAG: 5-oxoprolinase subunit B family protein [Limnobacter sp.]|uniref:5-oxoprolinase subunit B family protein n=1 Tax=Limnobacter sp. TaxID=2003368 RepID=UPI003918B65D